MHDVVTAMPTVYLGVLLIVVLLSSDPAGNQVILDRVGEGEVIVAGRGHVPVLDEGVVQVPVEGLLNFGHVLDADYSPHADLLPLLVIKLC